MLIFYEVLKKKAFKRLIKYWTRKSIYYRKVFEENNNSKDGRYAESINQSPTDSTETFKVPENGDSSVKKQKSIKTETSEKSTEEPKTAKVAPLILPDGWKQVYSKRKSI